MSITFKNYRRICFRAIRELLEHKGVEVVDAYIKMAKATSTENELSRVMADVREEI